MIRWLRAIWPPWWALLTAAFVFLGGQCGPLLIEWLLGIPLFSMRLESDNRAGLVASSGFLAVIYAVYRVWTFHPGLRPGYYQWLCGTPWTSRKPLPLGPIHLVWQDLLLLAIAVGLNWPRLQWDSLAVLRPFLAAYLIALASAFALTGDKLWAYAVAFALGFTFLFNNALPFYVGAAAVSYGVALLGLRSSLARFPWEGSRAGTKVNELLDFRTRGWPYDQLGPRLASAVQRPLSDTLISGLLAGWWLLAISWMVREMKLRDGVHNEDTFFVLFIYGLFVVLGVGGRVCVYCYGYMPPLTLFGRAMLGRWIIPGYDQVFVTPLLAIAVGVAAMCARFWSPVDPIVIASVALTVTWWILFGMGPSLQVWRDGEPPDRAGDCR